MKRHARAAIAIAAIGLSTSAWAASAAQAAAPDFTGVALGRTDQSSAMLVARINPEGSAITACEFEYGTTDAYGQSAPCLANTHTEAPFVGKDGTTILPAAALLEGLEEATTYHYRLVVSNGDGDVEGDDQSFATETEPESCDTCAGAEGKRRIELVSAVDKEQNNLSYAKLSADGNRVLYGAGGGAPESTFGAASFWLAERTPSGWRSRNALPANTGLPPGSKYDSPYLTSPDLSVRAQGIWASIFGGTPPSTVTLARLHEDTSQQALYTFPDIAQTEISSVASAAASDDLSHIFFNTREPIDATPPTGAGNVYDFGSGTPVLISRLPGGLPPQCGVPITNNLDGFVRGTIYGNARQHWSSTDGSHVFFQATPGSNCSAPQQLYRRDLETNTTALVSGPVVSGPDQGIAVPGLIQAAPDSSWVIYKTASRLDPADTNSDPDIYRWDAAGETNTCLTCVVPDANVIADTASAVASEDGSHVYFSSNEQLGGDAPASGGRKLYVWRSGPGGGAISYVAPGGGASPGANAGSDLSRNGQVLLFAAQDAGVTADNPADIREYFRYDDRDGGVICMSCPTGTASKVVDLVLAFLRQASDKGHVLSGDGESFVFQTEERLLPADVNAAPDIYEWRNGRLGLLSNGLTEEQGVAVIEVSRDGRDVLFKAPGEERLGAPDSTPQVYDARLGGGFPPPPVPPAPCAGEACKGAVPAPPSIPGATTPNFSGPLDPTPQRAGKGCGKGRHRVSQHGKSRCAKKKVRANHKRRAGR